MNLYIRVHVIPTQYSSVLKGEPCVMGERKIYKKRKSGAWCALSRDYSRTVVSEPCICAEWDFEW